MNNPATEPLPPQWLVVSPSDADFSTLPDISNLPPSALSGVLLSAWEMMLGCDPGDLAFLLPGGEVIESAKTEKLRKPLSIHLADVAVQEAAAVKEADKAAAAYAMATAKDLAKAITSTVATPEASYVSLMEANEFHDEMEKMLNDDTTEFGAAMKAAAKKMKVGVDFGDNSVTSVFVAPDPDAPPHPTVSKAVFDAITNGGSSMIKDELSRSASEISELAKSMHERNSGAREAWMAIGAALLRAKVKCDSTLMFGLWIKEAGIDSLPGLTSAASRSDAIWCAEFPDCVDLVPAEVTHPRRIRMEWRKLFKDAVKAEVAILEKHGFLEAESSRKKAADIVSEATHAPFDLALAAVVAACEHAMAGDDEDEHPLATAVAALHKALLKAKAAGVDYATVGAAANETWPDAAFSWADGPVQPSKVPPVWAWPEGLEDPGSVVNHILAKAADIGLDRADALKAVEAHWPAPYLTAEAAFEAARAALKVANENGTTMDDAKDLVMEIFW